MTAGNQLASDATDSGRDRMAPQGAVRVGTLLAIRWVAIVGQAGTLAFVDLVLGFQLSLADCSAVVVTSVLINLILLFTRRGVSWLPEREATLHLGYDIVQLGVLLYLTGGLENPFALMILAPITVSATILSLTSTWLLSVLASVVLTVIAVAHRPLPWIGDPPLLPQIYVFGLWVALITSTGFIAAYASRVSVEARSMAAALAATQMALARAQRLSALGALAAAAAHELGSPLGTIAVVAKELAHDVEPDSPLKPDIDLLISETGRCRDILSRLAQAPEDDAMSPLAAPPLSALVDEAAREVEGGAVPVLVEREGRGNVPEPHVPRLPEIVHGFSNLIHNAVQFAASQVIVRVGWSQRDISVTVTDDGPGFPPMVLARLGQPYLSSRPGHDGHMGLGVFIATTLLERSGATVSYGNLPGGGARVVIRWKRTIFEEFQPKQTP
jgi:two-component system sensor histidine kinase RegB